ncbi:hypothetical protein C2G38_2061363, partial [Gigaspora rosea]
DILTQARKSYIKNPAREFLNPAHPARCPSLHDAQYLFGLCQKLEVLLLKFRQNHD